MPHAPSIWWSYHLGFGFYQDALLQQHQTELPFVAGSDLVIEQSTSQDALSVRLAYFLKTAIGSHSPVSFEFETGLALRSLEFQEAILWSSHCWERTYCALSARTWQSTNFHHCSEKTIAGFRVPLEFMTLSLSRGEALIYSQLLRTFGGVSQGCTNRLTRWSC